MKITKRIEDYIKENVHIKFEPYYDKLEEPKRLMRQEIENAVRNLTQTIINEMYNILLKYYKPEDAKEKASRYYISEGYSGRHIFSNNDEQIESKIKELRNKENTIVNNILLELEFGGTKEKLDELIEAINPEE